MRASLLVVVALVILAPAMAQVLQPLADPTPATLSPSAKIVQPDVGSMVAAASLATAPVVDSATGVTTAGKTLGASGVSPVITNPDTTTESVKPLTIPRADGPVVLPLVRRRADGKVVDVAGKAIDTSAADAEAARRANASLAGCGTTCFGADCACNVNTSAPLVPPPLPNGAVGVTFLKPTTDGAVSSNALPPAVPAPAATSAGSKTLSPVLSAPTTIALVEEDPATTAAAQEAQRPRVVLPSGGDLKLPMLVPVSAPVDRYNNPNVVTNIESPNRVPGVTGLVPVIDNKDAGAQVPAREVPPAGLAVFPAVAKKDGSITDYQGNVIAPAGAAAAAPAAVPACLTCNAGAREVAPKSVPRGSLDSEAHRKEQEEIEHRLRHEANNRDARIAEETRKQGVAPALIALESEQVQATIAPVTAPVNEQGAVSAQRDLSYAPGSQGGVVTGIINTGKVPGATHISPVEHAEDGTVVSLVKPNVVPRGEPETGVLAFTMMKDGKIVNNNGQQVGTRSNDSTLATGAPAPSCAAWCVEYRLPECACPGLPKVVVAGTVPRGAPLNGVNGTAASVPVTPNGGASPASLTAPVYDVPNRVPVATALVEDAAEVETATGAARGRLVAATAAGTSATLKRLAAQLEARLRAKQQAEAAVRLAAAAPMPVEPVGGWNVDADLTAAAKTVDEARLTEVIVAENEQATDAGALALVELEGAPAPSSDELHEEMQARLRELHRLKEQLDHPDTAADAEPRNAAENVFSTKEIMHLAHDYSDAKSETTALLERINDLDAEEDAERRALMNQHARSVDNIIGDLENFHKRLRSENMEDTSDTAVEGFWN